MQFYFSSAVFHHDDIHVDKIISEYVHYLNTVFTRKSRFHFGWVSPIAFVVSLEDVVMCVCDVLM